MRHTLNANLPGSVATSATASGSARRGGTPPCTDHWTCCAGLGVERALITCDDDNRGSAT